MQFGMMDSYGYGMGYGMEILELILDTGNHRFEEKKKDLL